MQIKDLPRPLQNKIFYYWAQHPTAAAMAETEDWACYRAAMEPLVAGTTTWLVGHHYRPCVMSYFHFMHNYKISYGISVDCVVHRDNNTISSLGWNAKSRQFITQLADPSIRILD